MAEATIACGAKKIDLEPTTECLWNNVLCRERRSSLAKNAAVVQPGDVDDYRPPGSARRFNPLLGGRLFPFLDEMQIADWVSNAITDPPPARLRVYDGFPPLKIQQPPKSNLRGPLQAITLRLE